MIVIWSSVAPATGVPAAPVLVHAEDSPPEDGRVLQVRYAALVLGPQVCPCGPTRPDMGDTLRKRPDAGGGLRGRPDAGGSLRNRPDTCVS